MKNSSNRLIFPTFVCMEGSADKIFEVLKRYWGFTEFRPVQERIIRSAMAGRDTLALMPTGGGKSLTYQVPGLAQPGLCIVVTPLIALMKDQVDRLRARRIPAVAIHSGLSPRQIDIALDNCVYGDVKFLYVAPERLATEAFRLRVERMKVSLLAVCGKEAVAKGIKAGDIIKAIAPCVQGGGGGKPAMAQAGGKNAAGIDDALEAARKMLL